MFSDNGKYEVTERGQTIGYIQLSKDSNGYYTTSAHMADGTEIGRWGDYSFCEFMIRKVASC